MREGGGSFKRRDSNNSRVSKDSLTNKLQGILGRHNNGASFKSNLSNQEMTGVQRVMKTEGSGSGSGSGSSGLLGKAVNSGSSGNSYGMDYQPQ